MIDLDKIAFADLTGPIGAEVILWSQSSRSDSPPSLLPDFLLESGCWQLTMQVTRGKGLMHPMSTRHLLGRSGLRIAQVCCTDIKGADLSRGTHINGYAGCVGITAMLITSIVATNWVASPGIGLHHAAEDTTHLCARVVAELSDDVLDSASTIESCCVQSEFLKCVSAGVGQNVRLSRLFV